jgi:hypothetical protein
MRFFFPSLSLCVGSLVLMGGTSVSAADLETHRTPIYFVRAGATEQAIASIRTNVQQAGGTFIEGGNYVLVGSLASVPAPRFPGARPKLIRMRSVEDQPEGGSCQDVAPTGAFVGMAPTSLTVNREPAFLDFYYTAGTSIFYKTYTSAFNNAPSALGLPGVLLTRETGQGFAQAVTINGYPWDQVGVSYAYQGTDLITRRVYAGKVSLDGGVSGTWKLDARGRSVDTGTEWNFCTYLSLKQ